MTKTTTAAELLAYGQGLDQGFKEGRQQLYTFEEKEKAFALLFRQEFIKGPYWTGKAWDNYRLLMQIIGAWAQDPALPFLEESSRPEARAFLDQFGDDATCGQYFEYLAHGVFHGFIGDGMRRQPHDNS